MNGPTNLRACGAGRWRRWGAGAAAALAAACATPDPSPPPPAPTFAFAEQAPLQLPVAAIVLQEAYQPPLRPPHKEHEFSITPAEIVRRWARARLRAAGAEGTLTLIIHEASVVEEPIKGASHGVLSALRPGRDRRFVGALKVEAVYQPPEGGTRIDIVARGDVAIDRQANLNEIEARYNALLEALGARFDEALTRRLETEFAGAAGRR